MSEEIPIGFWRSHYKVDELEQRIGELEQALQVEGTENQCYRSCFPDPETARVAAQRIAELERELAECRQTVDCTSNLICNIQDTCRVRGATTGPLDERVIQTIQRLEKENVELRAETHRWSEADKQRVRDYDALSLQIVRLRAILKHSA